MLHRKQRVGGGKPSKRSTSIQNDLLCLQDFVRECVTCQCYKSEHLHPASLLLPLPVSQGVWSDIAIVTSSRCSLACEASRSSSPWSTGSASIPTSSCLLTRTSPSPSPKLSSPTLSAFMECRNPLCHTATQSSRRHSGTSSCAWWAPSYT
jgi:hypothetical protein